MALTAPLAAGPASGSELAARLAASIPIPMRLPVRFDGQPLRHLSNTSYTMFLSCPEKFRRRYILGEREPTTGPQFLGRRVDDALTLYYGRLLEGKRLSLPELQQHYRQSWKDAVEHTHATEGLTFGHEVGEQAARAIGQKALRYCFERFLPRLGLPIAVQRRVAFKVSPHVEWTVVGYIDLESEREDPSSERPLQALVDYKVAGKSLGESAARRDTQPSIYLAARWLEGSPADEFWFARVLKPGKHRQKMSGTLLLTTRTVGQLRATLARLALAAAQIVSLYERVGPERPWGFADPTDWRCSERYCAFWGACPGGSGL